jgi:hypothetical protein
MDKAEQVGPVVAAADENPVFHDFTLRNPRSEGKDVQKNTRYVVTGFLAITDPGLVQQGTDTVGRAGLALVESKKERARCFLLVEKIPTEVDMAAVIAAAAPGAWTQFAKDNPTGFADAVGIPALVAWASNSLVVAGGKEFRSAHDFIAAQTTMPPGVEAPKPEAAADVEKFLAYVEEEYGIPADKREFRALRRISPALHAIFGFIPAGGIEVDPDSFAFVGPK